MTAVPTILLAIACLLMFWNTWRGYQTLSPDLEDEKKRFASKERRVWLILLGLGLQLIAILVFPYFAFWMVLLAFNLLGTAARVFVRDQNLRSEKYSAAFRKRQLELGVVAVVAIALIFASLSMNPW